MIFRATFTCAFFTAAILVWHAGYAAPAPVAPGACGPINHGYQIAEPPAVDMWNAPVDASGEHELILAVHTDEDGNRFCYVYRWQGVVHYTAPVIHMRRGERFAIRIVNDISGPSPGESAPSTAIPPCKPMQMPNVPVQHWTGYLNHTIDDRYFAPDPIDTNLHLHGFEGPASEENIFLSTLSTPMHACEYNITIPRTQPPGTYVYHPHAHGASDAEATGGLIGAWIVDPDTPELPRADQHVLLLRYRLPLVPDTTPPSAASLTAFMLAGAHYEGALKPAAPVRYDPFNPPAWPITYPLRAGGIALSPTGCMGDIHEELLVSINNAGAPAFLTIPAGRPQLLHLVNATADDFKLLRLRDAQGRSVPFKVVERDGVPVSGDMQHPYAHYILMKELMVSPTSRAAILLTAQAGTALTLSSEPFCAGDDNEIELHHDLLSIRAAKAPGVSVPTLHSTPIAVNATPAAKLVAWVHAHPRRVHRRAITFTEYIFPKRGKTPAHLAYYITDTTNPDFHEHPFWPVYRPGATVPSNPDIVVKQGTVEVWYLINTTMETHAFHIHQMAFVNEHNYNGIPITVDTAFMPIGKLLPNPRDSDYPLVKPSITKVILDFRHVPRGTFVFHCHMFYHEDNGMMGVIRVE